MASAASTPMIATTIMSSTSVKPRTLLRFGAGVMALRLLPVL
jgi:hypothetical protein